MESIYYVILIILLLILGLSIWNILLFKKIKNSIRLKKEIDDKELYFELKYRVQLITTVFTIILAVITFYGYSSFDKFNEIITGQVKTEFGKHDDLYNILNNKKDSIVAEYHRINTELSALQQVNSDLSLVINRNSRETSRLQSTFVELSKKDILKDEIYIVKDLLIYNDSTKDGTTRARFYYKDLLTVNKKALPKFASPPSINIIPTNGGGLDILQTTNEYFEIECGWYTYSKTNFDVWIVKN